MTVSEYLHFWDHAEVLMDDFSPEYSVQPIQSRILFDHAVLVSQGGAIVELGVCHGRTSAMFAYLAKHLGFHYYGIDFFGLEGTSAEAVRNKFRIHGLRGEILDSNTHIAAREWE